MNLTMRHRELIAAVNNAKNDRDWNRENDILHGWRIGIGEAFGHEESGGWMKVIDWVDADLHHEGENSERPMCIGVFLDWKPTS